MEYVHTPHLGKVKTRQVLKVAAICAGAATVVLFGVSTFASRFTSSAPITEKVQAYQTPAAPTTFTKVSVGAQTQNLMNSLNQAGLYTAAISDVHRDFFSVVGKVITLGGGNLQAFEYSDNVSAMNEAALFKASAEANPESWRKQAHLYVKDALLVLYVGNRASILQALGPSFPL
jgi:hypothetical protein